MATKGNHMAQSINQNREFNVLPNFRSLGVMLRIVLLANGMALLLALAQASSWRDVLQRILDISTLIQPSLLLNLLLLFSLSPALSRLPYWYGIVTVLLLEIIVTLLVFYFEMPLNEPLAGSASFQVWRNILLGTAATTLLLVYFRIRKTALSPAIHEARLQALQARIRPHFLFNTINAVLGIIRSNPKRAESALEDMSDLFRMAMSQNSDLVPVHHEIELTRQYLALEKLRLGERLSVSWHTENLPDDALIPPLILQPLLENAVYHGIEPLVSGGNIEIKLYLSENQLHLEMNNPRQEHGRSKMGNKIALANIRERLKLQFDIEARYTVNAGKDSYQVHIALPYVKEVLPRGETR
ncbi:MAG: histidine kinase [Gallionellaceae bacterium]